MENPLPPLEMEKELYVAATNGNKRFLLKEGKSNSYLLRKTHKTENNIIHIAIRHEQHDFIEACLKKFSFNELFHQNSYKNNPLHTAAEVGNLFIVKLLYEYIEKYFEEYQSATTKPWEEKNLKGNTPLHVAIIHDNVSIAKFLLEKDHKLALIVNESNEAPLHLAIKQHANYSESESIMDKAQQPIHEGGAALPIKYAPQLDMSSMIKLLVQKAACVACWADTKGLTPLHKAASLVNPCNIQIIKFIIEHCPHAADIVCDKTGKSVLHLLINQIPNYQQGKKLLDIKEIIALRNCQDRQGNIPLHIAAKASDTVMVRVLLEASTKLNINNMEGISAASLIHRQNVLQMLRKRNMTDDEIEAANRADLNFLKERMEKLELDFLLSRDQNERNILHSLMEIKIGSRIKRDDFTNFIKHVVKTFPLLVCQTDVKGDTPIHVLVRNHPDTTIYIDTNIAQNNTRQYNDGYSNDITYYFHPTSLGNSKFLSSLLEIFNQFVLEVKEEAGKKGAHYDSPWLMQNVEGNTPLHEALKACNKELVIKLLTYEKEATQKATQLINKDKETPLHLLAAYPIYNEPYSWRDVELMVKENVKAAISPDKDSLTPLLRAFKVDNLSMATMLCRASPGAAFIGDVDSKTFGHLLVSHPSEIYFSRLFKDKASKDLLEIKDKNGDTPLHLAIENKRFDLVKILLEIWESSDETPPKVRESSDETLPKVRETSDETLPKVWESSNEKVKWLMKLLNIQNKAGKTSNDLIAESKDLPLSIEDKILDKKEMFGVRSVWRIPTSEINTYVNTMGIIAALLTTITFTAAFTVPGGLIQDKGTPILLGHKLFQVFMILDVSAMCLSMMVLFCLLWIMATNNRYNSVILLDFSVLLLLASFMATILTFMAGLFVTTFYVKPWISIVALVMCSLLILLVHRFFVINLLIPFGRAALIFVRMFGKCATGFSTKITKCCKRIRNPCPKQPEGQCRTCRARLNV